MEPTVVIAFGNHWESYLIQSSKALFFISMLQILYFSACCIYYLVIYKRSNISATTRRLQLRVFIGVVIQSLIPIILTNIPVITFLNKNTREQYDQISNNLLFISSIVQNGVASLSILMVHRPYRKFLVSIFCKEKVKVIQISVCSKTEQFRI